jgi:acetyl esterase/lipase
MSHRLRFSLLLLMLLASFAQASDAPRAFTYATPGGAPLQLFVFDPEAASAPAPAILLFHSGGWVRGRPEWLFDDARRFAGRGLVAIPVQYRLSTGGITPVDALADTCAALRWVRANAAELNVDTSRVAGFGASAGGQLIAAAATVGCAAVGGESGAAPDALILFSAGVDTENSAQFRALAGPGIDPADYSPLAHVGAGAPPTLILHGEEDSVTRLPASERFCARIRQSGGQCRLHAFPALGHLLTRQLDDQRSSIDADPQAVRQAQHLQELFLQELGYIEEL